jgi:hypothetical protein
MGELGIPAQQENMLLTFRKVTNQRLARNFIT